MKLVIYLGGDESLSMNLSKIFGSRKKQMVGPEVNTLSLKMVGLLNLLKITVKYPPIILIDTLINPIPLT